MPESHKHQRLGGHQDILPMGHTGILRAAAPVTTAAAAAAACVLCVLKGYGRKLLQKGDETAPHGGGWEAAYRTRGGWEATYRTRGSGADDTDETPHGVCYGREALRLLLDEILQDARSALQEPCAAVWQQQGALKSITGS